MAAPHLVRSFEPAPLTLGAAASVASTTLLPFSLVFFARKMWTDKRFEVHRLGGMLYLLQYCVAWWMYFFTPIAFNEYHMGMRVSVNGLLQALTAVYYFRFLRLTGASKLGTPGYFGDKGTMSYQFILENVFFQMFTVFGNMYYSPGGFQLLHNSSTRMKIIEALGVFFPYMLVRPMFPTTRFRNANKYDKGRSDENKSFYYWGTIAIKFFYISTKHIGGFVLMYMRYLGLFNAADAWALQGVQLGNAGTVSISIFLNTLRLKKVLPPRLAFGTYIALAYTPLISLLSVLHVFLSHPHMLLIGVVGCFVNLGPKWGQHAYQVLVFLLVVRFHNAAVAQGYGDLSNSTAAGAAGAVAGEL